MPTHQLLFGKTLWGLEGIASPREEGIERLAEAGFHVVEADCFCLVRDDLVARIQDAGLSIVVQCYPMAAREIVPVLERAHHIGALLVNAHAATPHLRPAEAEAFVNAVYDAAERTGIPLLLETHRGRLTQDLLRTADLAKAVPRLRVNLDVSHYVLAEEQPGPTEPLRELLDVLLDRTEMIHGRISNGEQIQLSPEQAGQAIIERYRLFWAEAMRRWRERAPAGRALIFTPEPGPPPYALTDAAGRELCDRWELAIALRDLARESWELASHANAPLW